MQAIHGRAQTLDGADADGARAALPADVVQTGDVPVPKSDLVGT
jgi:hypothetical protein